MRFCCLASGSEGNASLVESGESPTRLLIDCGVSPGLLREKLHVKGLSIEDLDGVLVTHEHGDHIRGIKGLLGDKSLSILMTYGSYSASFCRKVKKFSPIIISPHKSFEFKELKLMPFPVPHDAREPIALVLDDGKYKLGVLTDAGTITKHMQETLKGMDGLILEFNYDRDLLIQSSYPQVLKDRISSGVGHLSNDKAALLLRKIVHKKMQVIVAAHLSQTNNSMAIVKSYVDNSLGNFNPKLIIASQGEGTDWITLV
ncbi:MAG: hypothetical protein CBC42_06670 [Betaproteobacteria bacterium TMED82]|nr:MAG: hypothetical protein CBC42_06670 [Betaproteobacteria bacterium TMED82]|tara:strand:+ start:9370 stop:10143 length:774 start_codon:yes stop_codon:yes gene_type:complete